MSTPATPTASTGIERIDAAFARRREASQIALMPYITVGFPERDATAEIIEAYVEGGADLIELGIPFSDPLADGATVQRASQRALQNNVTLAFCIEETARLRERGIRIPLLHMTYYNLILHYGIERYCSDAATAGVDGLIVPDLPPEEGDPLYRAALKHGLAPVQFLAPTSTEARIKQVAELARGFIYCVSLTGVTGARNELPAYLSEYMTRVRAQTDKMLAIGFGISRPEHVAAVAKVADGAIVASALIDLLEELPREERSHTLRDFIRNLRPAS